AFEEKWKDIGLFVKYGMVSEDKFAEKATDFALLQNVEHEFYTLKEYAEKVKDLQKDKNDNVIYLYASDRLKQDGFITAAKAKGYDVLLFDSPIDGHFVNYLEQKVEKTQLKRVDSDVIDKLIQKEDENQLVLSEEESGTVKSIFEKAIQKDNMQVEVAALGNEDLPVTVTMDEF